MLRCWIRFGCLIFSCLICFFAVLVYVIGFVFVVVLMISFGRFRPKGLTQGPLLKDLF